MPYIAVVHFIFEICAGSLVTVSTTCKLVFSMLLKMYLYSCSKQLSRLKHDHNMLSRVAFHYISSTQ